MIAAPYLFALPFMLAFVAFVVAPLAYSGYLSLFKKAMVGGERFTGLDNYGRALADPDFWTGIFNCLQFGLVLTPVMVGIAIVCALILDGGIIRAGNLFRIGIFLPYAVPSVIGTLVWGYIYGPEYGLISQSLSALSLPAPNLMGRDWIIGSLANIAFWQYLGYNLVIIYAALTAVPRDLSEAATVDGANGVQIAWFVKLPMVRSAIIVVLLFAIIGTIQLFNEPFLLMPTAPSVITADFTPNIYVYSLAFRNGVLNYSAAISFTMGLVTAVLATVFLYLSRKAQV